MNEQQSSGWAVGWTAFAGIMMIMLGIWWVLAGLVGLFNQEFYVVTLNWIFQFNVATWAWVHLILGIIVTLAGFALFQGAVWARTIGVIFALISTLVAFAWLPWYPFWAILKIVVSIAVIWSLTVHGRDILEA